MRFVDRVFLRRRYEALASLDTIRQTLRSTDDPRRLTEEVATTLGLASLADARPQFALAVRRGDRVERAILVGPQRNGASLDRDAMRSLHGVFDEAIFA